MLTPSNSRRQPLCYQEGVLLLEGLIAILIFSLGVLAIVGLQASSMKAVSQAKSRVDASLIAHQRVSSIWLDMANIADYGEEDTVVAGLPSGKRTTDVAGDQVTVTVSWQMPGDDTEHSFVTVARINTNPL